MKERAGDLAVPLMAGSRLAPGLVAGNDGLVRCAWCNATPAYRRYHDEGWGLPVTNERRLFEKLCLEGFQAGLSWLTILNKREAFRTAFAVAKIESTIDNARRVLELRDECGSLAAYAWAFEPAPASRPRRLTVDALRALTTSAESTAMPKDLKRRGWSFVGPTTVYAFMQAMGLVNDHLAGCSGREHRRQRQREERAPNASSATMATAQPTSV